tara:strand:- start:2757 stop:3458 length:702 start_codon:yes stop_codon:yes gene_type:complete
MNILKILPPFIISIALFTSCGVSEVEKEQLKEQLKAELKEELREEFEPEQNDYDSPKQVDYSFRPNAKISKSARDVNYAGRIVRQLTWIDKNGENLALFTKKGFEIWVYHYAFTNGSPKLLRKVRDNEFNCEYDMSLDFMKKTIGVTDLDRDNYGELTFAYEKGCRSDVSPLDMKLLMIENGDKYIIRGSQTLDMDDYTYHGTKIIDPAFYNGPSSFLNHASNVWDRNERIVF